MYLFVSCRWFSTHFTKLKTINIEPRKYTVKWKHFFSCNRQCPGLWIGLLISKKEKTVATAVSSVPVPTLSACCSGGEKGGDSEPALQQSYGGYGDVAQKKVLPSPCPTGIEEGGKSSSCFSHGWWISFCLYVLRVWCHDIRTDLIKSSMTMTSVLRLWFLVACAWRLSGCHQQ
jgi:hypothetical protein